MANDVATIRRVNGGYILNVRWPLAGTPYCGGEMVCTTFEAAIQTLYKHLHPEQPVESCPVLAKKASLEG